MLWVNIWNPPTPVKMFVALVFMTASFGAMVAGAASENQMVSRVKLAGPVPAGVDLTQLDAGRLSFEGDSLVARGVLPLFARNAAMTAAVPKAYAAFIEGLEARTKDASAKAPVTVELTALPASFEDIKAKPDDAKATAALVGAVTDADGKVVSQAGARIVFRFEAPLDEGMKVELTNAATPRAWKQALEALATATQQNRVSGMWLFLSYLLATLGELCLSPVGLSMVTKLAPARFGSLFMGVWLLASSVAQYVGGSIGESWGKIPPVQYFQIFVVISVIGAAVLLVLSKPIRSMMHEVK
jgi:POT family proton-dependent oligopeptide transporter